MQAENYIIRTMTSSEINIAVEWAAGEGWNPGLHDADSFYAADHHGFLVGLLNNKPIACISAVKYGNEFGFIGFYIVKPEYRGKGYGIKIWNAAMDYLKDVNIGLDGVVEQQQNYKKSGFKLAYRNVRYEGSGGGSCLSPDNIVELKSIPFEDIAAYDRKFFSANRSEFLKAWINQADSKAVGIVVNDTLNGYAVLRKCREGYKVGPLFAETPEYAEALFTSLKSTLSEADYIYLDLPQPNSEAVKLAEKYNMKPVFETARMYTGNEPGLPVNKIFGVTSFELG